MVFGREWSLFRVGLSGLFFCCKKNAKMGKHLGEEENELVVGH